MELKIEALFDELTEVWYLKYLKDDWSFLWKKFLVDIAFFGLW